MAEFSGSERTVAGYLLAEVLERQPPEVRDLLLRTSVLERVSGPLADALTGGTGSEAILQGLEDANAFVTSLDAGADVVPLPPPVRRPAPARAAPHVAGADRLAAPRGGAVVRASTGTSSRRSGTPRRRATGRTPPACSPTTTSTWSSTAARRRCARCWPPSRPARPRATRSWRWPSPRLGSTTACSTRARLTSPPPSGSAATVPDDSAGGSSTCGWAARGSGSRASAATSRTARQAMQVSRKRTRPTRSARRDDHARLGADEPRHRRAVVAAAWTTRAATSRRRSRSPAASDGRTWRSAASATSRSRPS